MEDSDLKHAAKTIAWACIVPPLIYLGLSAFFMALGWLLYC